MPYPVFNTPKRNNCCSPGNEETAAQANNPLRVNLASSRVAGTQHYIRPHRHSTLQSTLGPIPMRTASASPIVDFQKVQQSLVFYLCFCTAFPCTSAIAPLGEAHSYHRLSLQEPLVVFEPLRQQIPSFPQAPQALRLWRTLGRASLMPFGIVSVG
jgi:hypothetical protein